MANITIFIKKTYFYYYYFYFIISKYEQTQQR